jgi:hypothetical protein
MFRHSLSSGRAKKTILEAVRGLYERDIVEQEVLESLEGLSMIALATCEVVDKPEDDLSWRKGRL